MLAQCHNAFADPCFSLHVRMSFSPNGSDSVTSWLVGRPIRSAESDRDFCSPCISSPP